MLGVLQKVINSDSKCGKWYVTITEIKEIIDSIAVDGCSLEASDVFDPGQFTDWQGDWKGGLLQKEDGSEHGRETGWGWPICWEEDWVGIWLEGELVWTVTKTLAGIMEGVKKARK